MVEEHVFKFFYVCATHIDLKEDMADAVDGYAERFRLSCQIRATADFTEVCSLVLTVSGYTQTKAFTPEFVKVLWSDFHWSFGGGVDIVPTSERFQ